MRTAQERRGIVKQVQKAVTPKITKKELADKLNMSRQSLDNRINGEDFTETEILKLEKLKIVKPKKRKP